MGAKLDYTMPQGGLSEICSVEIGGIKQTLLLQGYNPNNPVMLILHGGPTMPLPGVSSKGRDYTIVTNTKELIKHYVVVFWDQRGTGKSYHKDIPANTMNIKQFISDANEVTDYLRKRFNQQKIFLAAHSWGTTIGLAIASQYPEKYVSYVGLSQIVSWTENDKLALSWIKEEANRRGNKRAIKELNSIGNPPFIESVKQWGTLRKWQRNFNTLIYSDTDIKHPGLMEIMKHMFQSEEYSLVDIFNTYYRGFKLIYTQNFIEELAKQNYMDSINTINIPISLIHGKKDFHVHGSLAERYFNKLQAIKGKNFIWMEKSAHLFHPEDTKMIEQYLINELRHLSK